MILTRQFSTSGTDQQIASVGFKPRRIISGFVPSPSNPSGGVLDLPSTPSKPIVSVPVIPVESPVTLPDPIVPVGGNGNENISAGATGPSALSGLTGFFGTVGHGVSNLFTDTSVPSAPNAAPGTSSSNSTGTYLLIGAVILGLWIVLK